MAFRANEAFNLNHAHYQFCEHPSAPGLPYGQEGRRATVYQLIADDGSLHALKVFKPRFREPRLVAVGEKLGPYAMLPGLQVCQRTVLTGSRHPELLSGNPELTYAVLMPWVEGQTWQEIVLSKSALPPETCLKIARSLAQVLMSMEESGLAHCDLSGPNIIVGLDQSVSLVDVEEMYGPEFIRPKELSAGSSGYAHKTAQYGLWSDEADRFAGAVLLAEILGWCDRRVVDASWGESYFDTHMMQTECPRYNTLQHILRDLCGSWILELFDRAWRSESLADCPTFAEWNVALLTVVQGSENARIMARPTPLVNRRWRDIMANLEEMQTRGPQATDLGDNSITAQAALDAEEHETQHQEKQAGLYTEAVNLTQTGYYQEAPEKLEEVHQLGQKYPDRQKVERTPQDKRNSLSVSSAHKSKSWFLQFVLIGVLGVGGIVGVVAFYNRFSNPNSSTQTVYMPDQVSETATTALEVTSTNYSKAQPTTAPAIISGNDTVKVGLLAPLTDSIQTFGASIHEGVELAVKEWNARGGINGKQIELLAEDTQCDANLAIKAENKLINQENVNFIIGDICPETIVPISLIANAKHVIQISPNYTDEKLTEAGGGWIKDYIFRACLSDFSQGKMMAKFAASRGFKTAFVLWSLENNTGYSTGGFEENFTKLGGKIVGVERYTTTDTDFSAILKKVKSSHADVLFIPSNSGIINLIGAQAKQMGITSVMMGNDRWNSSDLDTKAVDGGFYSYHFDPDDPRPLVVEWIQMYGAAYKDNNGNPKVPDALATLGYEAATILFQSIQTAGNEDTTAVKSALEKGTFDVVTGIVKFDAKHNPIKDVVVMRVKDGEKTFIETVAP